MKQAKSHYRVSTKALIYNTDKTKFLCTLEKEGVWSIPGGGINHGEMAKTAIEREIKEEIGLKISKISNYPTYFTTYFGNNIWKANVFFEVEVKDLKFQTSEECVDIKFMDKKDLEKVKLASDLRALIEIL